jgi:hypothetical protein
MIAAVSSVAWSGLFGPLFDELADPALVARLSAEAEEAGWDGVFVWDHVRWREPVRDVLDPQITLAAIAVATERILPTSPRPRTLACSAREGARGVDEVDESRAALVTAQGLLMTFERSAARPHRYVHPTASRR